MRFATIMILGLTGACCLPTRSALGQTEDDLIRAGCPHQIANHARVGYGRKYTVYYVGGGARMSRGDLRQFHEGTFGVDYKPIVPGFRNGVILGWWHGRRLQGGAGQYEPNALVTPLPNLSGR